MKLQPVRLKRRDGGCASRMGDLKKGKSKRGDSKDRRADVKRFWGRMPLNQARGFFRKGRQHNLHGMMCLLAN